jgi:transcriptional regulator
VAVHAVGRLRLIEEPDALRALVGRLAAAYEGDTADAWSLERIPEAFASSLLDHIVGFEIPIDRLEGKAKLSQNRAEADRRGVIEALRAGAAPADAALADVMDAAMR